MNFTDAAAVQGTRRTSDGYLVADALAVRTGIQVYGGAEVGKPDMKSVRVLRPEAEVFHRDALASFAHVPLTNDHPPEQITADTWKTYAVGEVGNEVLRDGERMRIPLIVKDAAAISNILDGKRELSAGYTCDLDWTAGEHNGAAYDAIQKNIRANHVAIVDTGRAGKECRIGDADKANWGVSPIVQDKGRTMNTRTVMVDGLSVETTDQGAAAIEKLGKERDTARSALSDAEKAHKVTLDAKDEEIGKLKVDLQAAKDSAPKPEMLDKMVADRAELVGTIKAIDSKIEVSGKSDADLRRAAVRSKLGDEMVKDASDAEVNGMFKAISKTVDPVRDALAGGIVSTDVGAHRAVADKAYSDGISSLENAWKGKAA